MGQWERGCEQGGIQDQCGTSGGGVGGAGWEWLGGRYRVQFSRGFMTKPGPLFT
jgi:hypothetical protein